MLVRWIMIGVVAAWGLAGYLSYRIWKDEESRSPKPFALEEPLAGVPTPGDEAVAIAMQYFGIQGPDGMPSPRFAPDFEDRGLTECTAWSRYCSVVVGPAAFSSWAVLGSTLAHEIEVHGRQSFLGIWLMDQLGLDGLIYAERQAYQYELAMAHRFGTSQQDLDLIRVTMDHYYPDQTAEQPGLGVWGGVGGAALLRPVRHFLSHGLQTHF